MVSCQAIGKLTTSVPLQTQEGQTWMKTIAPVEQLLAKVFSMVSPKLHQAVVEVMLKVRWDDLQIGSQAWARDQIVETAWKWPGATPGISVISNHATMCHMDIKGHKEWYDLLVAAGTYEECWFHLPDLDLDLKYLPGTIVAFNGRFLRHEVVEWKGGDRVCYAHWVRPTLLRALSIDLPPWVTQSEYLDYFNN